MASPTNKTTPTDSQEIPKMRMGSSQPRITHAISLATIPLVHAITDKPSKEKNPPISAQTSQAGESSVPLQQEVVKPKRKRVVKNVIMVPSDNEHSVESSPSPKERRPTPKRRKVAPKEPSAQPSTQDSPAIENP